MEHMDTQASLKAIQEEFDRIFQSYSSQDRPIPGLRAALWEWYQRYRVVMVTGDILGGPLGGEYE